MAQVGRGSFHEQQRGQPQQPQGLRSPQASCGAVGDPGVAPVSLVPIPGAYLEHISLVRQRPAPQGVFKGNLGAMGLSGFVDPPGFPTRARAVLQPACSWGLGTALGPAEVSKLGRAFTTAWHLDRLGCRQAAGSALEDEGSLAR
jgi:hypothetical protein